MKVAIIIALLVACATAQQFRCKMPQLWRYYHNHTSAYRTYGRYAYDGLELRKWRFEEVAIGDPTQEEGVFEVLELYKERKAYVTDIKTKECKIYPLTRSFHDHGVPTTAKFVGYETFGAYPKTITLSQWVNHRMIGSENVTEYATFEDRTCTPVRDDHWDEDTGFHFEEFSDLTIGISDPNIWIPPSNCKE